jgi:chromosome segregation ATPase
MNEYNDKEISSLDEFFDDDPTDEFPALNLQDIDPQLAQQFDDAPIDDTGKLPIADYVDSEPRAPESESWTDENHTNPSLRQMELEIQALQTKWHAIEDDVRSRDEIIEILEAELVTRQSEADNLRAELDQSTTRLTEANEACARLTTENAEQLSIADRQQKRIQSAEAELVEQDATIDELREKIKNAAAEFSRASEASETLVAERVDCEKKIDSLTERLGIYEEELLRQTSKSETLQSELDDSRSSLTALAARSEKLTIENQAHLRAADEHAGRISVLQTENVKIRTQFDDLANYIAGRKSDWDNLHTEAARQREIILGLRQALSSKTETLALQKQENSALLAEMAQHRHESTRLHSALVKEKQMLADEQVQRRELRDRLAEKTKYANALEIANAELLELTASQHFMTGQLEAKNHEIERLNQALELLETEHAETAAALKKQQEVIQHIENEVRSKLEAITVIGRKAQRNISKPASVHQLDVKRSKSPAHRRKRRKKTTNRFMVALNGQPDNEFPIEYGTITIGRSSGNDICLRHHFISRSHAKILTDANGSVIEDLGSKNGILVNAEPVRRRRLRHGDVVDIGEIQFKFIDPVSHPGNHEAH